MRFMLELPEGYAYRVKHERAFPKYGSDPLPRGGKTKVEVGFTTETSGPNPVKIWVVEAEAWARCHSREQYNRKIGRDVALGRALKALEEGGGRRA